MKKILQWEPEKSRLWGNARIDNVLKLREDLTTLSDWINTKADADALRIKAAELEKALADTGRLLDAARDENARSVQDLRQEIQRAQETVQEEIRSFVTAHLQTIEGHARTVSEQVGQARGAAEASAQAREACLGYVRAAEGKAEELSRLLEERQSALRSMADTAEQHAARVAETSEAVDRTAADCRSAIQNVQDVHQAAQASQRELVEQLTAKLREAESQVAGAAQHQHLASAASEMAVSIKGECEELRTALQRRAEDLSASWDKAQQSLNAFSNTAAQHAFEASDFARHAQQAASDCQAGLHSIDELRGSLQTALDEVSQRIVSLEEMSVQMAPQVSTSGDHLQACQRIHSQVLETETRLNTLRQALEETVRQNTAAASQLDTLQKDLQSRLQTLPSTAGGFWERLRWLLRGTDSSKSSSTNPTPS